MQITTRIIKKDIREFSKRVYLSSLSTKVIVRNDWTKQEIQDVYDLPFMELIHRAAAVHRTYFDPSEVQRCTLLSIKTGGCVEDCKYCSQSSRHKTSVKATPTLKLEEVLERATKAREAGSTRFCMGAAWRDVGEMKDRKAFSSVLQMVKGVRALGMEVCCTLGMLTADQAKQLKEAGLTAYNHNLDTSREFYPEIVTTRTYDERLKTLANVRDAGINVCSGGILGLGEKEHDRVGLLYTLATLESHPESVPINALVQVAGTPLGDKGKENELGASPPTATEMTRMIATARIVMPKTIVRLSAGRMSYSMSEQALMFMAGANSIFYGEQLLTTPNPQVDMDNDLFKVLGLKGKEPFSPIGSSMVERTIENSTNYENMIMDSTIVRIDHSKSKRVSI